MHNVIEAAFPWLTVLIVVALVGALLLWLVKPLRGTPSPSGSAFRA